MSLAVVFSRALAGIEAPLVTVEVHLSNGLPGLSIVGLPETAVKESKDRVRGALLNSRFEFPIRRITVNLAPADLPKEGGRFDLPIAIGILVASGQVSAAHIKHFEFAGELALSGELRHVRGVLPMALQTREAGRTLIVPKENASQGALVSGVEVLGADHLLEVCEQLNKGDILQPQACPQWHDQPTGHPDLSDVKGQHGAKRALEIAAAGGHSLIMLGPPGTGKTMLASRLPGILPDMTETEALESAAIASVSINGLLPEQWRRRPFRAPHHTASGVALVGGGSHPRPGEISLAHNGVLFLDELPEFDRRVLEVLREPLESGRITISRAARQAEFYARFQLIAAMNPCPCGYFGHTSSRCNCSTEQIQRYRTRISGPLMDRIDMHIEVPSVPRKVLCGQKDKTAETSRQVRERVQKAREKQTKRTGCCNAVLNNTAIDRHCRLNEQDGRLLEQAMEKLGLSARAYHRILKVARTIADLAGSEKIATPHLTEAISYRRLDRPLT
jgi:magnesium chelatase family protein